jgi:hypothetical protein|tara:strand:+ start:204 stop:533 length:330 start_codon:yes stop_codon:yes gene_type:complete
MPNDQTPISRGTERQTIATWGGGLLALVAIRQSSGVTFYSLEQNGVAGMSIIAGPSDDMRELVAIAQATTGEAGLDANGAPLPLVGQTASWLKYAGLAIGGLVLYKLFS